MDFGTTTHPVARKQYRCEWCGEPILQNEKHMKYAGMYQSEFQNWRMHLECERQYQLENGWLFDGFTPFENERPHV